MLFAMETKAANASKVPVRYVDSNSLEDLLLPANSEIVPVDQKAFFEENF